MSLPIPVNRWAPNRRQSLQLAAATAGASLLGTQKGAAPADAMDLSAGPHTTPFVMPLPVSRVKTPVSSLTPEPTAGANLAGGECGRKSLQRLSEFPAPKYYSVVVQEAPHIFHQDLPVQKIWGYDGIYPGPTFVERYGQPVVMRIINQLPSPASGYGSPEISTHLHNLHTASESDGFAGDYYSARSAGPTLDAPGSFKDHHYPNFYAGFTDPRFSATQGDSREALGTLWYHDHRLDFTAANLYRGLAGFYLLFDELDSGNELDTHSGALRLPSGVGKYDVPLLFQDKFFDSSGMVQFDQFDTSGVLGNKFLVNGVIQPVMSVERRKYRFRLLDGGPARFYEFYLTNSAGENQPFTYIANDGNLLPKPLQAHKVMLGVAERGDIVIDFSAYPPGAKLYLVNRLIQVDGRGPEPAYINRRDRNGLLKAEGSQLLRFDVSNAVAPADPSRVPAELRPLPEISLRDVVKERTFRFDKENEVWTVNGKIFDVTTPVASPQRGTAEIWTLEAFGNWHHPVHIHFEEARILTRNGKAPPAHEMGRKDVFVLEPGEVVRVYIRFRDFLGKYMMHCHNATHEDHAMMIRYDIVE